MQEAMPESQRMVNGKGFRVTADRTDAWARALITPVVFKAAYDKMKRPIKKKRESQSTSRNIS